MKIGDIYKVGYICDCHKHNYDTGIISWINPFKYYPNGNINEFIMKTQFTVKFSDGHSITLFE